jgi:hypothetical protein
MMSLTKLSFILVLASFSFNVFSNCEPVNLYNNDSPLNQIPLVNQGRIATCYAQTTAQMVEYHLRKTFQEESPVRGPWVALNHKLKRKIHWSPGELGFSLLEWAIDDLRSRGNCSFKDYKHSLDKVRAGNNLNDDDTIYFLKEVFKRYKKYRKSFKYRKTALNRAYAEVVSSTYFKEKVVIGLRSSVDAMENFRRKKFLTYLRRSVFKSCTSLADMQSKIPKVISTARSFESDEMIIQVLNNVLTADRSQPVGLGYCSNILDYAPGTLGLMKRPRLLNLVLKLKKCSAHYSVIVGQRPVSNKCEFLIRNTYGTGKWANNRSCFCEFSSGSRGSCNSESLPTDSKVLGCWVDGKELASNTFDLSYFAN